MITKIVILAILAYLIWALFNHRKDKSLTFGIFIEYLLTAILVFVLLMGVIS